MNKFTGKCEDAAAWLLVREHQRATRSALSSRCAEDAEHCCLISFRANLRIALRRVPAAPWINDNEFVHATLRRRKLFACCGYGSLGACLAAWGASIFGHQSVLCVRAFTSRASGVESGAHMPAASLTSVLLVMLSLRSAAPSPSTLASAGNQDDFLAARVMMRRKPDAALPDVCSVVCV
jgi:hypothetical protein